MGKPMADYVKLPEFDEYKEWFKDFADLKREDGIVQVTWKTNDGPMHHSGMSHRAMSQLTRWLSLDFKNEIIIYTHIGDNWMIESDANGWETYSQLPTQRFQHQYFDDTNLIKNMIFDLDVPTIGAIPGPGFHWDSAMLCDITLCSEDTKMEVPHAQGGLVPGDGMGLMCQHYFGTKRGNYYMMTSRQFTAQQMLDWGMVNEVLPKGKVVERAWEIARMLKTMPYENRTIRGSEAAHRQRAVRLPAPRRRRRSGRRELRPAGREVHQPRGRLALRHPRHGGAPDRRVLTHHAPEGRRVVEEGKRG